MARNSSLTWLAMRPSRGRQTLRSSSLRSSFSSTTVLARPPSARWSPPAEPERPPVPYRKGFRFTASRVQPPPPFMGQYYQVPSGPFRDFLNKHRFPGRSFLYTTLTDYCSSTAAHPLPCTHLGETAEFEVLEEIAVGEGQGRGGGSQVVSCSRRGWEEPTVAKIYDPLYYPFFDDDFPQFPNDVVARAEGDFTLEYAAYTHLDSKIGGTLIPKFHGAWLLQVPLKQVSRPVGFILMEFVRGTPLSKLDPKRYTQQERLRVLAPSLEAEVRLHHAGVLHDDIAPRNVICSDTDFLVPDFSIKIIDFNSAQVFSVLGQRAPCEFEPLPESPVDYFWDSPPVDMWEWLPDGWGDPEWNQWLKETWVGSDRFRPAVKYLTKGE